MMNDGGGEGDTKGGIIIPKDKFKEFMEFQKSGWGRQDCAKLKQLVSFLYPLCPYLKYERRGY